MESKGNGAIHGLKGLEDEGIRGRTGSNVGGEGRIDDVDEERRREKGDVVVVQIRHGKEVRAVRESVGTG